METREFMRELTLRNERVWQGVMAGLEKNTQRLVDLGTEIADLRAESNAHSDALFRVLDELKRGEGGTSN